MATIRALNRNVPYLKQQFSALLKNTSPVITLICLVTSCGYLLSFSESATVALSVTPGLILPPSFWVWTAFTFCFIEFHLWEVLVDVVTVGLCGKLLEPLWGQMEMLRFFAVTNFGVALCSTFYYLFLYMCTKDSYILFDIHIHGLAGYVAGIAVAVRQIMPDHLIAKTKYGRLTNRNIPILILFFSIVLWALNLLGGTHPVMFCSGLIVSWVYLRFYQYHSNGRGDSSESFTFASFFPYIMQPLVSVLVNPLYLGCLKIGIVKPPAPPRSVSQSSLTSIMISMPGTDPHDVERRRQIALKALNERLKTDSNRQSTLPKSFPVQGGHKHHHGGHGHSHSGHGSHSGHQHSHGGVHQPHQHHPPAQQPQFNPHSFAAATSGLVNKNNDFIVPAIPLPYAPIEPAPAPTMTTTATAAVSTSNVDNFIDLETTTTTTTTDKPMAS